MEFSRGLLCLHAVMEPRIELQNLNESNVKKPMPNGKIDVAKAKKAIKQLKQIGLDSKRELRIWQEVLSGSLSSFKLTVALALLFTFYIFYIIFNNDRPDEINEREEDAITCNCRSTDSRRYTALLYTFSLLWVVILLMKISWNCFRFCYSKVKPDNGNEVRHKQEVKAIAKEEDEWHETLGHYEKSLIIQYLKVYSVGANQNNKKPKLPHPKEIFDFKVEQIDEDKNDDEDMLSQTDNLPGTDEVENITTARMLEYHRRDGYFQCALHWASINMLFCIDATDYGSDGIIISSINAVTVP